MTGRALYDKFTDQLRDVESEWFVSASRDGSQLPSQHSGAPPRAWPYLTSLDRRVWNRLAVKVTPKRAKA